MNGRIKEWLVDFLAWVIVLLIMPWLVIVWLLWLRHELIVLSKAHNLYMAIEYPEGL